MREVPLVSRLGVLRKVTLTLSHFAASSLKLLPSGDLVLALGVSDPLDQSDSVMIAKAESTRLRRDLGSTDIKLTSFSHLIHPGHNFPRYWPFARGIHGDHWISFD